MPLFRAMNGKTRALGGAQKPRASAPSPLQQTTLWQRRPASRAWQEAPALFCAHFAGQEQLIEPKWATAFNRKGRQDKDAKAAKKCLNRDRLTSFAPCCSAPCSSAPWFFCPTVVFANFAAVLRELCGYELCLSTERSTAFDR